jgi:hypothetical protein
MEIEEISELMLDELLEKEKEKEKHRRTRHHRERIINKRKKILQRWFVPDAYVMVHPLIKKSGKLAKYNLACSCCMCRMEKHWGLEKPQNRLFKTDKEDIENYLMQVNSKEE